LMPKMVQQCLVIGRRLFKMKFLLPQKVKMIFF
jgi:hypothetical protein